MTNEHMSDEKGELQLAAAAKEFGERAPRPNAVETERAILVGQLERHRALVDKVQRGLFAGQLNATEARSFLDRLAAISTAELGQERTDLFFDRTEDERPPLDDFRDMIRTVENKWSGEGPVADESSWRVIGLRPWQSYTSSKDGITGVVEISRVRDFAILDDRPTSFPIIRGNLTERLPEHPDRSGSRSYQILSDQSRTIQVKSSGEHVFGRLWVADADDRDLKDTRYLPVIDGEIWKTVDDHEIVRCQEVMAVTERGWTGIVEVAPDHRNLPVLESKIIEEIEGQTIKRTVSVAPSPAGGLSAIVFFANNDLPQLILDDKIVHLPTDSQGHRYVVGQRGTPDFSLGTFSGRFDLYDPALDSLLPHGNLPFHLHGRPLPAIGGVAIKDIQPLEWSRGLPRGIVRTADDRHLPLIDGTIMTHYEGHQIQSAKQIEWIDEQLNGILALSDDLVQNQTLILGGSRVEKLHGRELDIHFLCACHNIAGTLNGEVSFLDERRDDRRFGPLHAVVLGEVVGQKPERRRP